MRREAAWSRAFRVRRFWFGRPDATAVVAASATSVVLRRQLPDDGGEVDPDVFAPDPAVAGEFDDVQQAEFERAPFALQAEGPARRLAAPERLVHEEILAVEALQAFDLAVREV